MSTSEAEQRKQRFAEISEKYAEVIGAMSHRELLDDLERRAISAPIGYQDPITAMMLKSAKAELLRRLKGVENPKPAGAEEPAEDPPSAEPSRPTLFG